MFVPHFLNTTVGWSDASNHCEHIVLGGVSPIDHEYLSGVDCSIFQISKIDLLWCDFGQAASDCRTPKK